MSSGDLLGLSGQAFLVLFMVFLRIGSAMAFLPALGESPVPVRIRLVLALALTLVVAPAVAPLFAERPGTASGLLLGAAGEVLFGLAAGLALRLMIIALQVAGAIAAQSTSLSQVFGGMIADPQPAFGKILTVAGLALFVLLKLHVAVVAYLIQTYHLLPPWNLLAGPELIPWGLSEIARAFRLGFVLAGPFVAASLIYNVALGAINRAMPQLMVSFVGAPAITAGGLVLLALASPGMMSVWAGAVSRIAANPFGASP